MNNYVKNPGTLLFIIRDCVYMAHLFHILLTATGLKKTILRWFFPLNRNVESRSSSCGNSAHFC